MENKKELEEVGELISTAWEKLGNLELRGDAEMIKGDIRKILREVDMDLWALIEDLEELSQ
jgi:hypothetical protein